MDLQVILDFLGKYWVVLGIAVAIAGAVVREYIKLNCTPEVGLVNNL